MGLLTDPSAGQGKLVKLLFKYYMKLCILLYIGGIGWFCSLAYQPMNSETYFSENALLPGLVKSEFRESQAARQYYQELMDEMEKYDNSIPYPWLQAKFQQIGLEAYTHNFTLHYPLKNINFTGKNVYGILRAPRASSTESLVLSAPYRPPKSVHQTTAASIAIMLSFAKFAYRGQYWSKDIIFLITEHEQLGMQAWLEAYHGISCGSDNVLNHGDMRGRAGAIQAAINLELHDVHLGRIELKIEGLNGQLPNLDLFNLAARMCIKEDIPHTFKNRFYKRHKDPVGDFHNAFKTLMSMVTTQATGVPTGNHGLFYKFGIQALTLEGFAPGARRVVRADFQNVGRLLEGILRSLNNLLERFHQSFFFYLLPSADRFISIGLYIPSICLLVATLFIKAYAKWCQLHQNPLAISENIEEKNAEGKNAETSNVETDKLTNQMKGPEIKYPVNDKELGSGVAPRKFTLDEWKAKYLQERQIYYDFHLDEINLGSVCAIFIFSHVFGVIAKIIPSTLVRIGSEYNYSTEASLYYGLHILGIVSLGCFLIMNRLSIRSAMALNIMCLLELGTALICISMYNFSLGLCCAAFLVPFAILTFPTSCKMCNNVQKLLWFLVHPYTILHLTVLLYTYFAFPDETIKEIFIRSFSAAQHALVFSVVDNEVYGNWLWSITCVIFFSNWTAFWVSFFYDPLSVEDLTEGEEEKKLVKDKLE